MVVPHDDDTVFAMKDSRVIAIGGGARVAAKE